MRLGSVLVSMLLTKTDEFIFHGYAVEFHISVTDLHVFSETVNAECYQPSVRQFISLPVVEK
jgi:hypothetical protein